MNWSDCSPGGVATLGCLPPLIANIVLWALSFASTVSIFFIIVAGYKYITSHGDAKKIEEARKTMVFSLLGLMIIFLSFFIVGTIAKIAGVGCIDPSKSFSFKSCV